MRKSIKDSICTLIVVLAGILAVLFAGAEMWTAIKWFFTCFWSQNFEHPPLLYLAYVWICVLVALAAAWYKEK